jgi:protease II
MNILYIGPYRQKSIPGLTSLFILMNLLKNTNHKVSARPIYINKEPTNEDILQNIVKAEQEQYDNYDIVIQHTTADMSRKINAIKKNIIILINNEEILSEDTIEKLAGFDSVLVDSKTTYNLYKAYYPKIANKLVTYDYDIIIPPMQVGQFNVNPFEISKKLYFIGDYKDNINIIYNLCHSFIKHSVNSIDEHSLILYLFNMDPNTKQNITNNINQIYSSYGIKYAINRIIIAPIECNLINIITAHNTGLVYININESNSNSLNYKICNSLNKNILNFNDTDYIFEFTRNNRISDKNCLGISCSSIDNKINKLLNNNYTEQPQPFKKQHISTLI